MPDEFEFIKYEKKGHVAYVTINRPEVRNALHSYAYIELRSCWRDIGLDPNIYVGIVTGTGPAFCGGRDVKTSYSASQHPSPCPTARCSRPSCAVRRPYSSSTISIPRHCRRPG